VKRRKIVLSDAALNDILEQAAWYEEQSGSQLARRWEQAVISVLLRIAATPATGAPCTFEASELTECAVCLSRDFPGTSSVLSLP
jgi:plasmid stabilization system protein ParE